MSDTEELKARIADLEQQVAELRAQLYESEIQDWKARIDQLEVQAKLGSMEARDEINPVLERLRNLVLDARAQMEQSQSSVGDAIGSIREGVVNAVRDISQGWDDAISKLTGD
ncbi:MAG: hypothetical protein U0Q07_14995 [Acidimicrobiales bacterium]